MGRALRIGLQSCLGRHAGAIDQAGMPEALRRAVRRGAFLTPVTTGALLNVSEVERESNRWPDMLRDLRPKGSNRSGELIPKIVEGLSLCRGLQLVRSDQWSIPDGGAWVASSAATLVRQESSEARSAERDELATHDVERT